MMMMKGMMSASDAEERWFTSASRFTGASNAATKKNPKT